MTYLGIEIDETLSWNKHIEILSKKLSRTNGILSKLRYFIPLQTLSSVYYALFHSHICYGSSVWCYTSKKNTEKIFKLQKKCLRLMTFSHYLTHSTPLFNSLKIMKVGDLIKSQILKLTYFFFNDKLPVQLSNFFQKNMSISSYNMRNDHVLLIPKTNTYKYGVNSLRHNAPLLWNEFVKRNGKKISAVSTSKFKKLLKKYFLQNY